MKTNTRKTTELLQNKDLFELLLRKEKFSEYIDTDYNEQFTDLISEITELKKEVLEWWDIEWELMDVIFWLWQLICKLLKEWKIDSLNFKAQKEKIFKRSPNLKACKKVSREVENIIWQKTKNEQTT